MNAGFSVPKSSDLDWLLLSSHKTCPTKSVYHRTQPAEVHPSPITVRVPSMGQRKLFIIYYIWIIGLMGRVFANGPGDWGSIPDRVIRKTFFKWYLMPPYLTLSIIRYVSRVKWSNPGKGVHFGVVAIEKGAFGSPSTIVANFISTIITELI